MATDDFDRYEPYDFDAFEVLPDVTCSSMSPCELPGCEYCAADVSFEGLDEEGGAA